MDMTFNLLMDLAELLCSIDQEDKGKVEERERHINKLLIGDFSGIQNS